MTVVFVDSGAWIALSIVRDSNHRRATSLLRSLPPNARLSTSNYVVAETCTWIRYHDSHAAATDFFRKVDQMVEEDALALLWVDKDVHRQAWEIFERYEDQNLSFLDCTSFVLARRLRVDFVFGFDRDFYVMNFDLRPGPER